MNSLSILSKIRLEKNLNEILTISINFHAQCLNKDIDESIVSLSAFGSQFGFFLLRYSGRTYISSAQFSTLFSYFHVVEKLFIKVYREL